MHSFPRSFTALIRVVSLVSLTLAAAACSTPTGATDPLSISCPSVPAATSFTGAPVAVTFAAPTVKDGSSSVTTTCSPQSGTTFPVGNTSVTCQAPQITDRAASCTFSVTVRLQARLLYTRFLGFGDSITEGKVSPPLGASSLAFRHQLSLLDEPAQLALLESRLLVNNDKAYPQLMRTRLAAQYPQQTITVANDGLGGEYASTHLEPSGALRLPGSLSANTPEVLLLMEGTNDMLNASGPDTAILALDQMVQTALNQGRKVCLATIAPIRPATSLRAQQQSRIPGFNDRIRSLAASRNIPVVDVYNALIGDVPNLIGEDHLHPTERGYQVIADTFFNVVRTAFEQGTTAGQTPK